MASDVDDLIVKPQGNEHPILTINRVSCSLSPEDRTTLRLLVKQIQHEHGYAAIETLLHKSVGAIFREYATLITEDLKLAVNEKLDSAKKPRSYGVPAFPILASIEPQLSKPMSDYVFGNWYQAILSNLGIEHAFEEAKYQKIEALQQVNGVHLPQSLVQYTAVTVDKINSCYNRFLPIESAAMNNQKIVFLEEYHFKWVWGVEQASSAHSDGTVWCGGITPEGFQWRVEHASCRDFLSLMMIWNGTFGGGFPITAEGFVDEVEAARLFDRDWTFLAEVNGIKAFQRSGVAACFCRQEDLMQKLEGLGSGRIYLAGQNQALLQHTKNCFSGKWR